MDEVTLLPVSGIIPTRNRAESLRRTLQSFSEQNCQPTEIIVIDGSDDDLSLQIIGNGVVNLWSNIVYAKASVLGAASQRNQGCELAKFSFILFTDDDIFLEPHCLERLWNAISNPDEVGGVSAMITNQKYLPMGRFSSAIAAFLLGRRMNSYAGKLIPPGWGMLPEDRDNLAEVVEVEWLNTTATIYKSKVLPSPPFDLHFKGYSLMEDVALSAIVAKKWKLMNARTARIYHDSQTGDHKRNVFAMSRMELVNRHYIMVQILERRSIVDYFKLLILEAFGLLSLFRGFTSLRTLPAVLGGKIMAIYDISRRS